MDVFFIWCTLLPDCLGFGIAVFRVLGLPLCTGASTCGLGLYFVFGFVWIPLLLFWILLVLLWVFHS